MKQSLGIPTLACLALSLAEAAQAQAGRPSGAQQGPLGAFGALLPLIVIFVIFYLLLILPMRRRQKKHQEMLAKIAKGDRVVTSGGIFGTVVSVEDDIVQLRVAENVKLQVARSAIAGQAKDAGTADLNPTEPK